MRRLILMAAPTCTLWRWNDYYFGYEFVLWPSLKIAMSWRDRRHA